METNDAVKRVNGYDPESGWFKPEPPPARDSHPKEFKDVFLPKRLRAWACDVSERMQVPLDYAGAAMISMTGAVIGRRIGIRPKKHDDWTVVPNLWGMIVGRPGVMKSPVLSEVLKPINRLEAKSAEQYHIALEEYEILKKVNEAKAGEQKKRLKQSTGLIDAQVIIEEFRVEPPLWKRYIVNDSTQEKLADILQHNPNGVLLFRDELSGFFASLKKQGQESARKFFLEGWNGTEGYTVDRIGRGTTRVPHLCISIFGSIQPSVLSGMLRNGLAGGVEDDGLFQRFQLMVYPHTPAEFTNIDRPPNREAKIQAFEMIEYLAGLDASLLGAEQDDDERRGVPFLRFDDGGQIEFDNWRTELEKRARSGEEHPAFESHLAKYRSLLPSIALIWHLAEGKTGPVSHEAVFFAIEFLEYLESHARRIYSPVITPEVDALYNLANHLLKGDLDDEFTLRDVYRKGWIGLNDKYKAEQAVKGLLDLKWLDEQHEYKSGRPTTRYLINPRIYE